MIKANKIQLPEIKKSENSNLRKSLIDAINNKVEKPILKIYNAEQLKENDEV